MFKMRRSLTIATMASVFFGLCATPALADDHRAHSGNSPYGPCYYEYGETVGTPQGFIQSVSLACGGFTLCVHHQYWINWSQGIKGWTNYACGVVGQGLVRDAITPGQYIQTFGYAVQH
jgi:hypothetical protein